MRNKIFIVLGILLVVVAVGTYFLFDTNMKQSSQAMGTNVLIAKKNIPEGTVIKSTKQAESLFEVRRIAQAEIVPSSIEVDVVRKKEENFINKIKNSFALDNLEISETDLKALINKKTTVEIYKNQQVLNAFLSDDIVEFEEHERYFAVPTSYIDAVGAEVSKDDYIDLWIHYGEKHSKEGVSEKIIEALQVVKVKGANNEEVKGSEGIVPTLIIFKMNEEQISFVSQKMHEGTLFLTKWGVTPKIDPSIVIDAGKEELKDKNEKEHIEKNIEAEVGQNGEIKEITEKEGENNKEGACNELGNEQ